MATTMGPPTERMNEFTVQVDGSEALSAMADIAQHEARDLCLDGVVAALKGKRAAAERLLRASLALDPRDHRAWLWLAGVVVQPEESIECLKRVLELSPNNPYALEGMEWARKKLDNQQDVVSPERTSLPEQKPDQARSKVVSFSAVTVPTWKRRQHLRWWGSLTASGVLLILASFALFWANGGSPRSLWQGVRTASFEPTESVGGIAARNSPAWTRAESPAEDGDSDALAPLIVATSVIAEFNPPLQGQLTGRIIPVATSPAVILPSPTSASLAVASPVGGLPGSFSVSAMSVPLPAERPSPVREGLAIATAPAVPESEQEDGVPFTPQWHPHSSPLAALRRSTWRLPTALWDKQLPRQEPKPGHKGKWIDIDISEQTLRAFEDDRPVMEFKVSTGPKDAPTVKGEFRILSKYRAIDMSGPGYYVPAVPHAMFFHDGYAIHGAYWHDKFGQPTGHGCVNMRPKDAKRLFEWSEPVMNGRDRHVRATDKNPGTLVLIHD